MSRFALEFSNIIVISATKQCWSCFLYPQPDNGEHCDTTAIRGQRTIYILSVRAPACDGTPYAFPRRDGQTKLTLRISYVSFFSI